MNRFANPILMIIPPELFGLIVVGMLICGGLAITVGARKLGKGLVLGAIALPFVMFIVEALMNDLFAAMPEALIMPVAFLITVTAWIMLGWALLRVVFGQAALSNAGGIILADTIRGGARLLSSRPIVVIGALVFTSLYWSA
jgi:hypothetical protein